MSECINSFFIKNNDIIAAENFKDKNIIKGTSLYEVIRVIEGVPLFLEQHLARVVKSATIKGLGLPYDIETVKSGILKLIKCNSINTGNIKFIFNYQEACNFYAYFINHKYPIEDNYKRGVDTILYFGERKDPNVKAINLDFRKKVEEEIKNNSVYEAILVNNNGNITEGSKSNIFLIKDKTVYTAPKEEVLMGITRDRIIQLCNMLGYNVIEEAVNYKEIKFFDALFISGTSPKVLPVSKVDKYAFNSAENTVLLDILKKYDEMVNDYINSEKFSKK